MLSMETAAYALQVLRGLGHRCAAGPRLRSLHARGGAHAVPPVPPTTAVPAGMPTFRLLCPAMHLRDVRRTVRRDYACLTGVPPPMLKENWDFDSECLTGELLRKAMVPELTTTAVRPLGILVCTYNNALPGVCNPKQVGWLPTS